MKFEGLTPVSTGLLRAFLTRTPAEAIIEGQRRSHPMIRKQNWRPFCCVLIGIGLSLALAGSMPAADAAEDQAETVALIVDYGDGVQKHFPRLAWRDGMTVFDLTQAAKAHPRGIDFQYRGQGATAFLFQIDDLKNEGRGRNWLYRINDKLADRSFALQTVRANDRVVWEFSRYQEN
jgi:hypothetical protein